MNSYLLALHSGPGGCNDAPYMYQVLHRTTRVNDFARQKFLCSSPRSRYCCDWFFFFFCYNNDLNFRWLMSIRCPIYSYKISWFIIFYSSPRPHFNEKYLWFLWLSYFIIVLCINSDIVALRNILVEIFTTLIYWCFGGSWLVLEPIPVGVSGIVILVILDIAEVQQMSVYVGLPRTITANPIQYV